MSTLSLRDAWADTAAQLGSRPEARWMLEVACNLDGAEFDASLDLALTERMVAHLDSMLARRRSGEPLQYVLGRWAFRHLDLFVDERVLIPRPETELVAGRAIELAKQFAPRRVVDLGTGSGAIGLSLASELPLDSTEVWLTDHSTDALDVARANLAGIGRAGTNVRIAAGDWYDALPDGLTFDVIVSNPPYVAAGSDDLDASVRDWEPHDALFAGDDGLDDYRRIITAAGKWLNPGGCLVLEIGADQGAEVRELMETAGFADLTIEQDLAGHDRIASGQTRRGD